MTALPGSVMHSSPGQNAKKTMECGQIVKMTLIVPSSEGSSYFACKHDVERHEASHQLVWESQVAQDPWSRVSIKVRHHLAWIPEVGWEAACIRWGRGGGFFPRKTQWKSVKNRGPPYCYWKKITNWYGRYPIIYKGFMHVIYISHYLPGFIHIIISHYVPGFYIYPKRVVVLKRDFFSRWSRWTPGKKTRFQVVELLDFQATKKALTKNRWNTKHKTPTADFFL